MCVKVKNSGEFIIYLNNYKFQLKRITTQTIQLKMFDIAVTLKYGRGHWKCYDQVKLSE